MRAATLQRETAGRPSCDCHWHAAMLPVGTRPSSSSVRSHGSLHASHRRRCCNNPRSAVRPVTILFLASQALGLRSVGALGRCRFTQQLSHGCRQLPLHERGANRTFKHVSHCFHMWVA